MITVCIPSLPMRSMYLHRALNSVARQTLVPSAIEVAVDRTRAGAAITRDEALARVETPWTAFLDDDDELYPRHLELLYYYAIEANADLVYPWFDVIGGTDPFPQFFKQPWRNDAPHQTTVTFLARTEALRSVGGFSNFTDDGSVDEWGNRAGEEYQLVLRLVAQHRRIAHLPQRTWRWHHHSSNTSGRPDRVR